MDKYAMIAKDAAWVIEHYGSNEMDKKEPGSKLASQAERIAEFVHQLDTAIALLIKHNLSLVRIEGRE